MHTIVVNKKGQLIDGRYRDEIIAAHDKGQAFTTIDGDEITIKLKSATKDERVLEINV